METEATYAPSPSLGDAVAVLWRRWFLIAMTTAIAIALGVAYIVVAPRYFTASTEILIDPRKKNTVENEVLPSGLGTTASDNFALVDSQMKVITSDVVLKPVVESQNLAENPEFNGTERGIAARAIGFVSELLGGSGAGPAASPEELALWNLRNAITVERDTETYVIVITVTTRNAVKSAEIARAIADAYLRDQSGERLETTQRVSSQMDAQLATLRDRLLKAEGKVQKFRAENDLQISENDVLIDTRQLEQLNEKLADAKADLAKTQAKYDQLQRLLKSGVDPDAMAESINSSTVTGLRDQYATAARREAVLSASLLPSHPTMVQARSEVQRLAGLIRAEVERIAKAIKLENDAAKERLRAAEAALAASRKDVNTSDSAIVELRELQREAETTRAVYESFLSRVKQMNESESVYTPDARIITPASIPLKPSSPKKLLTLALASMAGFMLGCALALVRDFTGQPSTHTNTELLTRSGLTPLISIPALRPQRGLIGTGRGGQSAPPNLYEIAIEVLDGGARSRYRSAVMQLLSYIMDLEASDQPRIVTLTSALPGEGKTALALSLGVGAASSGLKTLLVDASNSNPALTKMLGQESTGRSYRDRLVSDAQLGLSFLSLQDAAGQRSSEHVRKRELEELAGRYDLTVIDGGLLKDDTTMEPLISISEAVLLVSQSKKSSPAVDASAAADLLEMARGRYCASVLTMANA
ncbi:GumC family protein [Methyloceanibacter caenitepidi]|uniref:Succinoglycan biosynthesis transport protein exop n=1 Tax=Methyloceanibacter caenitepidi TaxID=1384459 RepID=A0A0A8K111_9HYPH|nr:exopolysaccharide transport family protein [Methyloceanibacter caenitepidi]BAQ15684.1 succinoglycan biosynthesis transport protein exop [Methyloceanibacter caenitepidi]